MTSSDQDLIDRLHTAGEGTVAVTAVPPGLAHRARTAGIRRRRTVRSLTAATLVASAALVAGVAVSGWDLPLFGDQRTIHPAKTAAEAVVDGVRIGHLPVGYDLSGEAVTEEIDGEWLTRAVFNPDGKPAGRHRGSIVISVWRIWPGGHGGPSFKPDDAKARRFAARTGSEEYQWVSQSGRSVDTFAAVSVEGMEVASSVVEDIAGHLTQLTDPLGCPATSPSPPSVPGSRPARLVPDDVRVAIACRYAGFNEVVPAGTLTARAFLTEPQPFVAAVNSAVPPEAGAWSCPADLGSTDLIVFIGPTSGRTTVAVARTGCAWMTPPLGGALVTPDALRHALSDPKTPWTGVTSTASGQPDPSGR